MERAWVCNDGLYGMGVITDEEWPVLVKRFAEKAAESVTEVGDE